MLDFKSVFHIFSLPTSQNCSFFLLHFSFYWKSLKKKMLDGRCCDKKKWCHIFREIDGNIFAEIGTMFSRNFIVNCVHITRSPIVAIKIRLIGDFHGSSVPISLWSTYQRINYICSKTLFFPNWVQTFWFDGIFVPK